MIKRLKTGLIFVALVVVGFVFVSADEGMWLLNNLPLKQLKDRYNFTPSSEWVEHVQKSSARLPNCSTSFVSPEGLLMTNWHCSEEAVKALSTLQKNYYEDGFYAKTFAEELKTNLNVRVLMSIEDRGVQKPGLLCEEVVLYLGGQYRSYCYKVYEDIRLVFMPERNVGFFGGDADNFEYPRYTLDVSFLRAYEGGKPARVEHYFKWSKSGAKDGELIFVSGHPGSTKRMLTYEALKTERDIKVPFLLDLFRRRELTTHQFMLRGNKQERIGESDLFGWQNVRKLYVGKIRGLQDSSLLYEKETFENRLDDSSRNDPILHSKLTAALALIEDSQNAMREIYSKYMLLVRGFGFDSRLFEYAMSLVVQNPSFAEEVFKRRLVDIPIDLEYEEAKLRDSLTHLVEVFGRDNDFVSSLFYYFGSGPVDAAHDLVNFTFISDLEQHRKMIKSGPSPVQQSQDHMIYLANLLMSSDERKSLIEKMKEISDGERQGYAGLSDVLFKLYGTDRYPDATFTLRLAFGTVKPVYNEKSTTTLPWTIIGEAYKHASDFGDSGDYKLPGRWYKKKSSVNLSVPLNFVSTLDITGGNSGSPVLNSNLEIVGIVFDSNIEGLVSDYDYGYSSRSRAISVHSAGIVELLSKVYGANRLIRELKGR
ncbi:MAG: hypothetical protein A3J46_06240 [Candidatus Yanofskybacteria bacterium RIFCSPHIGHO2_02_FULL_41_11]|uniref:Dipeptidyl-peptidase n=1 Tax=Candidatus Yanofskybacteria bacterium RIFCSPHIGHO2_02_FULL_41_11 TaxID=1802675 RepID=A0A1F8F674_9BACT|nr:MAG: hypothetical protein A3J46_06240 [Candidatus Yanofskybacteria bacterium RIFCSPHIGHO2_02_FULL_41_11]